MTRRSAMRVMYVLTSLKPGGAERQMLALAMRLDRARFQPEFICTSEPGMYAELAQQHGILVHSLGSSPRPGLGPAAMLAHRTRKLLRFLHLLRSRRPGLIDVWFYPIYHFVALARPLIGSCVVVGGRRNLRISARRRT